MILIHRILHVRQELYEDWSWCWKGQWKHESNSIWSPSPDTLLMSELSSTFGNQQPDNHPRGQKGRDITAVRIRTLLSNIRRRFFFTQILFVCTTECNTVNAWTGRLCAPLSPSERLHVSPLSLTAFSLHFWVRQFGKAINTFAFRWMVIEQVIQTYLI